MGRPGLLYTGCRPVWHTWGTVLGPGIPSPRQASPYVTILPSRTDLPVYTGSKSRVLLPESLWRAPPRTLRYREEPPPSPASERVSTRDV